VSFDFRRRATKRRHFSREAYRLVRAREHYYSLYFILVVEIILFFSLGGLLIGTMNTLQKAFRNIEPFWRIALPAAIAIVAAVIGWTIYKNIKEILALNRELQQQRRQ